MLQDRLEERLEQLEAHTPGILAPYLWHFALYDGMVVRMYDSFMKAYDDAFTKYDLRGGEFCIKQLTPPDHVEFCPWNMEVRD